MKNKLQGFAETLRGKLTLWYISSVGLIIWVFLTAAGILFWLTLQNQIDHHVLIAVNEASEIVENYIGEERDELLKNLVSAQGMTIIVLTPDGLPILETNSPDVAAVTEHELQRILASANLHETRPVHFSESRIRFAAKPVEISGGKGIVAVGYSAQVLLATFSSMLLIVGGVVVFLVAPITYAGYRLLGKQLKPLESIAAQAKKISSRGLSARINIETSTRELVAIQTALNTMLTQIEAVFSNERQFFSDAAHTLKTPLAVLRSQIENSRIDKGSKEKMLLTIDEASSTIEDLLFLAKVGARSQATEKFSLSKMLADTAELITVLGEEKKLRVDSRIQEGVKLKANKKLVQRALVNIAHNAVIYNREKGSVFLGLSSRLGKIRIVISDTGKGVEKSDQTKLFTRFFRGKNAAGHRGSGLGLAIAQAVIEDLGGKITLRSKVNGGTQVEIVLPT